MFTTTEFIKTKKPPFTSKSGLYFIVSKRIRIRMPSRTCEQVL